MHLARTKAEQFPSVLALSDIGFVGYLVAGCLYSFTMSLELMSLRSSFGSWPKWDGWYSNDTILLSCIINTF
jgi:hypothetical protein